METGNGPRRFRLLAIDIDGTLVNSRDELTSPTRAALRRASEAGIRVVLATGRRYSRTLPLVEPLGISVPLITASGALVKDPRDHRTLYCAGFERVVLCGTLRILSQCGFDAVLCGDTYHAGYDYYQARQDTPCPELAEYLNVNEGCGLLWPDLINRPPEGIFGFFTMGTHQQMLELESRLHRELPAQLTTHVLRSPRYFGFMCEIAPWGVTKWSAVQWLAADWGIPREAICAVGDDVNDIPMIREAGLGVAMGNALPCVKAAADRIAPSQDEDGLVEVIEWLLEEELDREGSARE